MANTGRESVLTLKEVIPPCPIPCTPTGNVKPNIIGEPDYIAPYINLVNCPVTVDTTCPALQATGGVGVIEFEFSVPITVLMNPSISKIKILIMNSDGTVEETSVEYSFPMSPSITYKYDTISPITSGSHQIDTQYLDSEDSIVASCLDLANVTVT